MLSRLSITLRARVVNVVGATESLAAEKRLKLVVALAPDLLPRTHIAVQGYCVVEIRIGAPAL